MLPTLSVSITTYVPMEMLMHTRHVFVCIRLAMWLLFVLLFDDVYHLCKLYELKLKLFLLFECFLCSFSCIAYRRICSLVLFHVEPKSGLVYR